MVFYFSQGKDHIALERQWFRKSCVNYSILFLPNLMNVIFFLPCPICWSDSVPFTVPETDQVYFYFIAPPQDLSSALLHLLSSSMGSTSSLPSALCFKCLLDQRGLPSLINLNKITATLPIPPHTHTHTPPLFAFCILSEISSSAITFCIYLIVWPSLLA